MKTPAELSVLGDVEIGMRSEADAKLVEDFQSGERLTDTPPPKKRGIRLVMVVPPMLTFAAFINA